MVWDRPLRPFPGPLPGDGPVLQRVCDASLELLDVSGVVVAVMSDGDGGGAVAGAGPHAQELFDLHLDIGEGPCHDAFATGVEVLVDDLVATGPARWPGFTAASAAFGIAAVFALPSSLGAIDVGVLQLQRDRTGPLSPAQLADARLVAELCGTLLIDHQAGLDDDAALTDAWPHRIVVHQATGMVSVQLRTSLADALARLRAYAFAHDRPLEDVAHDVVDRRLRMDA